MKAWLAKKEKYIIVDINEIGEIKMNIKEKINKFLDKYDIVEREDDVEFICNYEKLNSITLNKKQIKFVNRPIQRRNLEPIIASIIFILITVLLWFLVDNKTMSQIMLLFIFDVVGIIFLVKAVKKLKKEFNNNMKAYVAKVIEKNLVHAGRSSGYVVRVLFEHNQKDFVSLKYNKFAKKINVGDRIIVVKTNNHLYAMPYDYFTDDAI